MIPGECPDVLWALVVSYWETLPKNRPTCSEVVFSFDSITSQAANDARDSAEAMLGKERNEWEKLLLDKASRERELACMYQGEATRSTWSRRRFRTRKASYILVQRSQGLGVTPRGLPALTRSACCRRISTAASCHLDDCMRV